MPKTDTAQYTGVRIAKQTEPRFSSTTQCGELLLAIQPGWNICCLCGRLGQLINRMVYVSAPLVCCPIFMLFVIIEKPANQTSKSPKQQMPEHFLSVDYGKSAGEAQPVLLKHKKRSYNYSRHTSDPFPSPPMPLPFIERKRGDFPSPWEKGTG